MTLVRGSKGALYAAVRTDGSGYVRNSHITRRFKDVHGSLPAGKWLVEVEDNILVMNDKQLYETYEVL